MPGTATLPRGTTSRFDEERALDVLSDVLALLRLRGDVHCRADFSAPFGLSFSSDDSHYHVVEQGSCFLQASGSSEALRLTGGDLVVLPHGHGHKLFDSARSPVVPIRRVIEVKGERPIGALRFGGGGTVTRIICGRFPFDRTLAASVLSGLPAVIHVPGSGGRPPEWLDLTMRFLAAEAHSTAPGRSIAMSRLVDLLFVEAVRHWLATSGERPLGWIGALRDPRVGAALARMHAQPERAWDVEGLAAEAAMSRSAFAQRFVELVGEPPSKYLTRWRIYLAARLLRTPGATIAQTAARVGYESEAAFSRVFKRYMHVAPAAFRDGNARAPQMRKTA